MTSYEESVMSHFNGEKRLQHVAITRGREKVFLTYVRRNLVSELKESSFLMKLAPSAAFKCFPVSAREGAILAKTTRRSEMLNV